MTFWMKKLEQLRVYKDHLIGKIEQEYNEVRDDTRRKQEEITQNYEKIIKEEQRKMGCLEKAL